MAIEFVGYAAANYGTALTTLRTLSLTSLTGGIGTAAQAGDLVVAIGATGAGGGTTSRSIDFTPDYNSLINILQTNTNVSSATNGSAGVLLDTKYKVLSGADISISAQTSGGGNSEGFLIIASVYRGVDPNIPFGAVTTISAPGSRLANPPASGVAPTGSAILALAVNGGNSTVRTYTAAPAGYSNMAAWSDPDFFNIAAAISLKTDSLGGVEDPDAYSINLADSTTGAWAAATLVLNPISSAVYKGNFIPFFM